MLHRTIRLLANIGLVVLLSLCVVIPSCKKSPQKSVPAAPQPAGAAAPKADAQAQRPAAKADSNAAGAQKVAADKPGGDLEAIGLVLPKPMFVGTPQSFQGIANLEKPLGKPRAPFYAPKGTVNVAAKKPVKSSDEEPIIGEIEMITDGDKEAADGSYVELGPLLQHVTVDLGGEYNIYAVVIWHYHKQARVYKDVIVQVGDDPDFVAGVRTVFNNDDDNSAGLGIGTDMNYVETSEGKLIDAKGVRGRYVRCYSNGNTSNDMNNYIEVEVYGTPAK